MKAVAALLGLVFAVLISYSESAPQPNCCGLGNGCGNYYGGECCGGLTCGPALTCIAEEYGPYPGYAGPHLRYISSPQEAWGPSDRGFYDAFRGSLFYE